MLQRKQIRRIVCILLGMCMLTGCSNEIQTVVDNAAAQVEKEEVLSLGMTPEFDYEVPVMLPSILVDQVGYGVESSKIAVFTGEDLPYGFSVIDKETRQVVYEGKIEEKGYDEITGNYISYGDFTRLEEEGEYYIQADVIGQSYPFQIRKEPYEEVFNTALKQYYYNRCGTTLSAQLAGNAAHNACHTKEAQQKEEASVKLDVSGGWHVDENGNRDVIKGCQAVNYLLLAYEMYPDVFSDEVGIPESGNEIPDVLDEVTYEITWLLKMQDSTSGAVYGAVNNVDSKNAGYILYLDSITMDATIQFAATMAKFSYLYQNYDHAFATQCLKAADRAYRYAEKYLEDVEPEQYFYAATEMYRATGNYGYHTAIINYLTQNQTLDMVNDFVFWGTVTYLSTKQRVDVNLCSSSIKILMQQAERISYAAKNSRLLVDEEKIQKSNSELLQDITRLSVVDHIITNHEYATVLENYLHYFLGRNLQSVSYLDGAGDRSYREIDEKQGIMNQVDLDAQLLLMMSAVLNYEEEFIVSIS